MKYVLHKRITIFCNFCNYDYDRHKKKQTARKHFLFHVLNVKPKHNDRNDYTLPTFFRTQLCEQWNTNLIQHKLLIKVYKAENLESIKPYYTYTEGTHREIETCGYIHFHFYIQLNMRWSKTLKNFILKINLTIFHLSTFIPLIFANIWIGCCCRRYNFGI